MNTIDKVKNQVKIQAKESSRILEVLGQLKMLKSVDISQLIDPKDKTISNFSLLKEVVKMRAKSYETLSLITQLIEERTADSEPKCELETKQGDSELEQNQETRMTSTQECMQSMFSDLIEPHKEIVWVVESKVKSIINSVEEHISHIENNSRFIYNSKSIREGLKKLRFVIETARTSDSQPEAVGLLHHQLVFNHQHFKDHIEDEMATVMNSFLTAPRIDFGSKKNLVDKK